MYGVHSPLGMLRHRRLSSASTFAARLDARYIGAANRMPTGDARELSTSSIF